MLLYPVTANIPINRCPFPVIGHHPLPSIIDGKCHSSPISPGRGGGAEEGGGGAEVTSRGSQVEESTDLLEKGRGYL